MKCAIVLQQHSRAPSSEGRGSEAANPVSWQRQRMKHLHTWKHGWMGRLDVERVNVYITLQRRHAVHLYSEINFSLPVLVKVHTSIKNKFGFWDMTPCSLMEVYRRFDDIYCHHLLVSDWAKQIISKKQVTRSFSSVNVYQTTRCHIPQGSTVRSQRRGNLKSKFRFVQTRCVAGKDQYEQKIVSALNYCFCFQLFVWSLLALPCLSEIDRKQYL
jgi:hypothetical protein